MAETHEQYTSRVIAELLQSSVNGVLTKPHLQKIFREAEKQYPHLNGIELNFKKLIKQKVIADFGVMYNHKGMAVCAYTNAENLQRANQWREEQDRLSKYHAHLQKGDKNPYVLKASQCVPPLSGGDPGPVPEEQSDAGEGPEECWADAGSAYPICRIGPDGGLLLDERVSLPPAGEQDPDSGGGDVLPVHHGQ